MINLLSELKPLERDYLTNEQIQFLERGYENTDYLWKRKAREIALRFLILGMIEESELKVVAELCRERLSKSIMYNEVRVFELVFDLLLNNHQYKNLYFNFKLLYENNRLKEFEYEYEGLTNLYQCFYFEFFTDNVVFLKFDEHRHEYEFENNSIKHLLREGKIDIIEAMQQHDDFIQNKSLRIMRDSTSKRKQFEKMQEKLIEESIEHDLKMEEFKHITDIVKHWNETSERLKSNTRL